jgi:flagellar biosynthetic protein FliO
MAGVEGSSFFAQAVGVVLALGLVLLLAWLVLKLLSRTAQGRSAAGSGPALRVERVLAVGARERLVLVRHGPTRLLLGVTAGSIHVLERTPADHADTNDNAAKGPDSVVL